MSLYKSYKTDKELELNGIWVTFGDKEAFNISRAGGSNSRYIKLMKRTLKPFKRQVDNGTLPLDKEAEIFAEVYAKTIVIGWRTAVPVKNKKDKWEFVEKIEVADGKMVEFSVEACKQLLIDLPELMADLMAHAVQASNFLEEEEDEAVKQ